MQERENSSPRQTELTLRRYLGVDVAKATLEVAWPDRPDTETLANDAAGHGTLLARLAAWPGLCVICEATGGYERALVAALHAAGRPVVVADPQAVHHFGRGLAGRAKSDPRDARVLRHFGEVKQPAPQVAPTAGAQRLRELVDGRGQLVERQSQLRNHLEQTRERLVKTQLRAALAQAARHLAKLDQAIAAQLQAEYAALATRLQQEPGLGPQTTAVLLAKLPELGRIGRRSVGALVGVAPLNRDSGQSSLPRHIGGGRHSLRRNLWMPTLVAVRHHPAIRSFYQRLIAAGKPPKVALVAAMRKLLLILNAIARQTLFPKNTSTSATTLIPT